MSDEFVDQIRRLVAKGDYRFSQHAATELVNDQILVTEPVARPETWRTVEFYPDFDKGKAVLVLQPATANGPALHLLWGVAAGYDRPAVLSRHTVQTLNVGLRTYCGGGDDHAKRASMGA